MASTTFPGNIPFSNSSVFLDQHTVRWLGQQAVSKYEKLMQNKLEKSDEIQHCVEEVRKTRGGAILDPDDLVNDVLDNNDFVTISK